MPGRFIEFMPGQKHPSANPEYSDTPDVFDDCGYELGGDEVVIDIDELGKDGIREMIKRFNIKTQTVWTTRGAHLYFRKPMEFVKVIQGVSPLGFKYEMKTDKNQKAVTIKREGKIRDTENLGVRQELPWFFYDRKRYPADLTGMSEHDGRNNALFAHRMKLGNRSDIRKILLFINQCVFSDPLTDQELENIAARQSMDVKTAETREASKLIIEQCRPVVWQNKIYWFDGAEYLTDVDDVRLKQMILMKYPDQETRFVKEIIEQIRILAEQMNEPVFAIKLTNGVIQDGEFFEMKNFRTFTPYRIDVEYDENAASVEMVDEYLDNVTDHDPDYRKMLEEAMAYPMVTDPEVIRSIGKFFFFRGNGSNGKGTMLQIMKRIYGAQNCTYCSPSELANEKYICTVIGKLANLGDDIEPDAINNKTMKTLKNIATADTVSLRELFKNAVSGTITAKMYFTTNAEIKTFEKSYAYKRRVMWLPMFNKVEKPDPQFITKITSPEALRYWIRLMVQGYMRLIRQRGFTECEKIKEFNIEYHKNNNYMNAFIDSVNIDTDIIGHTGPEVRSLWNDFNDDPAKTYNPKLLNEAMEDIGIISSIAWDNLTKKSKRIYIRVDDNGK